MIRDSSHKRVHKGNLAVFGKITKGDSYSILIATMRFLVHVNINIHKSFLNQLQHGGYKSISYIALRLNK